MVVIALLDKQAALTAMSRAFGVAAADVSTVVERLKVTEGRCCSGDKHDLSSVRQS